MLAASYKGEHATRSYKGEHATSPSYGALEVQRAPKPQHYRTVRLARAL